MKSILLALICLCQILMTYAQETKPPNRPQNPTAPYPYYTEEVSFKNTADSVTLAGTLSLPTGTGNYPVVVLITGSGPQNRNEELFNHKPFLVLADYLTRRGIGVLRYDDRGVGQSTGNFKTATSASFAGDAAAAVAYLKTRKQVNKRQIGLIGHSEGGMIAPMLAAGNKDIAFIVLMAGPGEPITELMDQQNRRSAELQGVPEETIVKNAQLLQGLYNIIKQNHTDSLNAQLTTYLTKGIATFPAEMRPPAEAMPQFIAGQLKSLTTPWFKYFIGYNPAPNLAKVKCPVLAINGMLDVQVLFKPNLAGIKQALIQGKNKHYKIVEYEGMNHLFQEAKTGDVTEYKTIEQTISPKVLNDMAVWINGITGNKL